MSERYDVVVVGVGGMGSAALYHLARRGKRVLGLERFEVPHERGSSHGLTRIIRQAYFEHPSYVPLVLRAYELWRELEAEAGEQLLFVTGALEGGPRIFEGAVRSSVEHGLPYEELDGAEAARRFPAFRLPPELRLVFQRDGGFLLSERCIVAHVAGALARGAELRTGERVLEWSAGENGVRVRTDRGDGRGRAARAHRGRVLAGRRTAARPGWSSRSGRCSRGSSRCGPSSSRPTASRSSTSRSTRGTCTASPSTACPGSRSASTTTTA